VVIGEGKSLELVLASHVAHDKKHQSNKQIAMPMDGKATLSTNIFLSLAEFMLMVGFLRWAGCQPAIRVY
jgi:hypothetical protein